MRRKGAPQRGTSEERTGPEPVREADLIAQLVTSGGLWSEIRVVGQTGSTNADVAEFARAGAPDGFVLVAESQHAGRGRMGRSWEAPAGTGLTMSVLLRPRGIGPARFGWLPLLAGVAVAEACAQLPGVRAALKWPNDLLVRPEKAPETGWGKCGGILGEAVDDEAVVVGIGVNVSQGESQLPPPADPRAYPATSLARAGAACDRTRLAVDVLRELERWYGRWRAAGADPEESGLRAAYLRHCATLGREVTASLPGGGSVQGRATSVDSDGRLVLATPEGQRRLAAGDVHHLRATRSVDDPPVQPRVPLAPAG